jgi:predicted AAA+ superfamily ATPase
MVRRLLPWHANLGKRLVKSPKIYLRDSGIFHALQGIGSNLELLTHPKLGASWEGYALEQTVAALRPFELYFYAVHSGAELDLFLPTAGRRLGVEFKRQDAPKITRSMRVAWEDLQLDELWIVYPGTREYTIEPHIRVKPLAAFTGNDWGNQSE